MSRKTFIPNGIDGFLVLKMLVLLYLILTKENIFWPELLKLIFSIVSGQWKTTLKTEFIPYYKFMRLHCSLLQIWFGSSRDSLQGDGLSGLFLLHKFSFLAWNFSLLSPTICLPGNLIIWNSPILNLIKIKSEELDIQFEFRTWVKTKLNQSALQKDCPVLTRFTNHIVKCIVLVR